MEAKERIPITDKQDKEKRIPVRVNDDVGKRILLESKRQQR
jgi:hypothetical protein